MTKRASYQFFDILQYDDTGKTEKWVVLKKGGDVALGEIRWFSRWRRYCFFPDYGTVFSTDCLEDIISFIESEMEKRRHGA